MEVGKSHATSSVYAAAIREALPRVLSTLDREPFSKVFGCADRVFWSWKFTDFPGARFQEIAYMLAELMNNDALTFATSFRREILLDWTKAAINFWGTLQHRDGSFDEAYPYERSLAATAFTCFYVGQAFLKIKKAYSCEEQQRFTYIFRSAGNWLCNNDERHGILSNHLAAAAAALQVIAEITLEDRFIQRRDYFIGRILQHQSCEGWYEEYGGADPGYQTHTTFYLAYVWMKAKNQPLLESLRNSILYFWHFVHVDGSIGGEYGSRNTRFFMPAGFEMLAEEIPEAAAVACFMRTSLSQQAVVGLHAMDTYNISPLINNYLFACQFAKRWDENRLPRLPCQLIGVQRYPQSGHIVLSTPAYQAIINTLKGGVISVFSKKNLMTTWSDAGVVLAFSSGKKISSQGLGCGRVQKSNETSITIESHFTEINQVLMTYEKFIAFRFVSVALMLFPSFAYHLKNLLVKVLVSRKKPWPARLIRQIVWNDENIFVTDEIILEKHTSRGRLKNVFVGGRFSVIHMGSSRYFEWQELTQSFKTCSLLDEQVKQLNETGKLVINHPWRV